jgi:hypothetical protein
MSVLVKMVFSMAKDEEVCSFFACEGRQPDSILIFAD